MSIDAISLIEPSLAARAHPGACSFGVLGGDEARLLAGPVRAHGREALVAHRERLGPLSLDDWSPGELRDLITESGLLGRGGGQFPIASKLHLAASSPGAPIIVVNASEGEPASRKDRTLVEMRPHLVLDGALVAARAVNAAEIVIYLHRSRRRMTEALEAAIGERSASERSVFRIIDAPNRYIAGESSAVTAYLSGSGGLPRRRAVPVAAEGIAKRPTVVSNVETIAHLALIARFGAAWFRAAGSLGSTGSTLLTLAGEVTVPGLVVEILGPVSLGEILATAGGLAHPPAAVLVGGYSGTWIVGSAAWRLPLDRGAAGDGAPALGCGVIAALGHGSCGLATTSRLVDWLAGESAGQCGPCAIGLPEIADRFDALDHGPSLQRRARALRERSRSIRGRGACGLPSGVIGLVESALDVFCAEGPSQRHHGKCAPATHGFPLPDGVAGTR